jgi:hypothetical protein
MATGLPVTGHAVKSAENEWTKSASAASLRVVGRFSVDTDVVNFLLCGLWGADRHVMGAEKLAHSVEIAPSLIIAVFRQA